VRSLNSERGRRLQELLATIEWEQSDGEKPRYPLSDIDIG
jgi:hypothetical protein